MPFILICRQESASAMKQEVSPENAMVIEQDSDFTLNTSFKSDSSIDILGDLDIIGSMEMQDYTAEEPERREKPEKRKKGKWERFIDFNLIVYGSSLMLPPQLKLGSYFPKQAKTIEN